MDLLWMFSLMCHFCLITFGTAAPEHSSPGPALLMRLKRQMEAMQALQENIQRTLEQVQALQGGVGGRTRDQQQQTDCRGSTYPLDSTSTFAFSDEIVTMSNQHAVRVDDILYGYDTLVEEQRLNWVGSWLGVQCQQAPTDLVVLQQIMWDVKPKVVLDIGTLVGGSALLFAHVMSQYAAPGEAVVITVDPRHFVLNADLPNMKLCRNCSSVLGQPLWEDFVQYVQARATDPAALNALKDALVKYGGPVLVSIDGSHEYPEVLRQCTTLAKFVSLGSYMIVQRTRLDRLRNRLGPRQAVYDFLANNTKFAIDKSREIFLYSQHTDGFLLRTRP